ncbi:hypothetical protein V6N11_054955 [Hibiscus sabdariffa]|uniref:RNase H type-1 domain-containing protein n=1 Tax=Hibiscus sabdariffa TaxID=183260 RepID=A0ABR2P3J0_9ROSI
MIFDPNSNYHVDVLMHGDRLAVEYIFTFAPESRSPSLAIVNSIYWSRPPRGWVKANVDVSVVSGDGHVAIGDVLRDENGSWILGSGRPIGCCSVLTTELWAVQDMLAQAWRLDIRQLVLETDCLEVVKILNGSSKAMDGHSLIRLIQGWTQKNWNLVIRHVTRDHNQLTDKLVALGRTAPRDGVLFVNPPAELLQLVEDDVAHSLQELDASIWRENAHTICFNLMNDPGV